MARKHPAFWFTYHGDAELRRWSNRPWADPPAAGGKKQGRVEDFGTITRWLTDWQGNWRGGGFRARLSNMDRLLQQLNQSEHVKNREATLDLLSDIGRITGQTPRTIYRGLVSEMPMELGLKGVLQGEDLIGSQLSRMSLGKILPQRTYTREDFPNMHRDLVGHPCQVPYGLISDEGAVDSEGFMAEKGRHKVIWLGYDWEIGYHIFGVAGCAIKRINQWYASDLSEITQPDRVRQEEDTAGVDFLIPGYTGWPHANPYVDINGRRYTLIYAAGPRADHHIQGIVNITLNICGIEDVGDSSGDMINQLFFIYQHLFEHWIFSNDGRGYQGGLWAAPPAWANGLSFVKSSTFLAAQELTKAFLNNDLGYEGVFDLDNFMSVREIIRYAALSGNCLFGPDWDGRLMAKVFSNIVDPEEGMDIREKIEAIHMPPPRLAWNEVENEISYNYGWDNDQDRWSADLETIRNQQSIDELRDVYKATTPHPLRFLAHAPVARDAMARRLLRLKYPPKYLNPTLDLCGIDPELGDQVLITSQAEGLGPTGYLRQPFVYVGVTVNASRGEVTPELLDLTSIGQLDENVLTVVPDSGVAEAEIPADGWVLG